MDLLHNGASNEVATLQYSHEDGLVVDSIQANKLRDAWGQIHPRCVHPSMYDPVSMQPTEFGQEYLRTIFTNAIGRDDTELIQSESFSPGKLATRYQSSNIDIRKRTRYL